MSSNKNEEMKKMIPGFGIIIGLVIGELIGMARFGNLALYAALGAGIGLVIGAVVSLLITKKSKT